MCACNSPDCASKSFMVEEIGSRCAVNSLIVGGGSETGTLSVWFGGWSGIEVGFTGEIGSSGKGKPSIWLVFSSRCVVLSREAGEWTF